MICFRRPYFRDFRTFAGKFAMPAEDFLGKKLNERKGVNAFRQLRLPDGKIDFCSNDYLGIATNGLIEKAAAMTAVAAKPPEANPPGANASLSKEWPHGSTGSRLLAGNYPLIEEAEKALAAFHSTPAALIFNSGYDANLGVLGCIPQRGDTVLYDALSHASIRDGMRLSFAKAYSFAHNDCADLEKKLQLAPAAGTLFVVTESVFSMDGDLAPLQEITALCDRYNAYLIVDEAHATGIIGPKGEGLVQQLGLEDKCFARIHTFGKAVGCHGAVVAGSSLLRDYLINFSRSFIYTTALPPASIQAINTAYALLPTLQTERRQLQKLIKKFQQATLKYTRLDSPTPIQVVIVPGNEEVKQVAKKLQDAGLDVRPILYPTVPRDSERLRIVLHAFNTEQELNQLIALLQ
jgi:8-amino-7-oxononanoate synthase